MAIVPNIPLAYAPRSLLRLPSSFLHSALLCVHTRSIHMFAISLTYRQTTCTYFPSLISVVYPALPPYILGTLLYSLYTLLLLPYLRGLRQAFANGSLDQHPMLYQYCNVGSCSYSLHSNLGRVFS